jgi:hypothetical protein
MENLYRTAVLAVLALLVSGCGSDSPVVTAAELVTKVGESRSHTVEAVWVWGSGSDNPVRMTGRGQWDDHGSVRRWVNEWNGTRTESMITVDEVVDETGMTYDINSPEGRFRAENDLFAGADPLMVAAGYKIELRGEGDHLSGRGDCSTDGAPCIARLHVELDERGLPLKARIVLTRMTTTDQYTYRYRKIIV